MFSEQEDGLSWELRIVSGGQTGVDRAALDAALECSLSITGWCPRGREAEDGPISRKYPLRETGSSASSVRTLFNVEESDGTLILHSGKIAGGTAVTRNFADQLGKAKLEIDLCGSPDPEAVTSWIVGHQIRALNVAGPRESESQGIYELAHCFLMKVFRSCLQASE